CESPLRCSLPEIRRQLPLPHGACSSGNSAHGEARRAARMELASYSYGRPRRFLVLHTGGGALPRYGRGSALPCWRRGTTSPAPWRQSPDPPYGMSSWRGPNRQNRGKAATVPEIDQESGARALAPE